MEINFRKLPVYLSLFTLLFFLAALPILIQETQKPQKTSTRAETPVMGGTLALSPATDELTLNQETEIQILVSTGSFQADGVDVRLSYDPQVIEIISISEGNIPEITLYPSKVVNPAAGKILLSGVISTGGSPFSGDNLLFATIRLKPMALTDQTTISFEFIGPLSADPFDTHRRNDSNIAEHPGRFNDLLEQVVNGTYRVSLPPTPTPTPTPTPLPVSFDLKIELQGRRQANTSRSRKVMIQIPTLGFTKSVVLDDAGQTEIMPTNQVSPGKYDLLIKPEGYLQKQFTINLTTGLNSLDLSATHEFTAGDLDNSGEINSIDYSMIIAAWSTADNLADIDGSGKVNSLDASIIIANWRKTGDQEGS